MAKLEIILPAMGEGITEATITKLLKNIGDKVEEDEAIIEIATDKVDSEITSQESGVVEKFLYGEGDEVSIGEVVAIISTASTNNTDKAETEKIETKKVAVEVKNESIETEKKSVELDILHTNKTPNGKFLSPLVRNIAKKEGLNISDLDNVTGTGVEGRITKNDLLDFIKKSKSTNKKTETIIEKTKTTTSNTGFEIIEMDRMRKLIAGYMIKSKQTSAHVTSFIEVDVTSIVKWRTKVKDNFLNKYNEKITFTPIFIEATVQAIRDFPLINISVDGDNILLKKNINIGMAAALPSGNLIVPVIKSAGDLNMLGLTKSVNDLASRARNNKLKPDEIQGGTFTITNLGTFGNITGTPIINQPEVAILAVGAIKKKPAVIETPQGDTIGIRHLMVMSMSYDHRVVDGALGGMFLKRVADILESFDINRDI